MFLGCFFLLLFLHFPVGSAAHANGLTLETDSFDWFDCFLSVFLVSVLFAFLHFLVGSGRMVLFWKLIGLIALICFWCFFGSVFLWCSSIFRSVAGEWPQFENWLVWLVPLVFDWFLNAFGLFFDWFSCIFRSVARRMQMVSFFKRIRLIGLIDFWLVLG